MGTPAGTTRGFGEGEFREIGGMIAEVLDGLKKSNQAVAADALMRARVDGTPDDQNRFVSRLRVITSAVSLGHDESLIVHVGTDGPRVAAYPDEFRQWGHLRFSVGLEDPEDLEADLRQALDATFG